MSDPPYAQRSWRVKQNARVFGVAMSAAPAARSFDIANFHHYGSRNEAKIRFDFMNRELARAGAGARPVW